MLIAHINVKVKPEHLDAFIAATLENAQASLREPGIARFDILQDPQNPTSFIFVEAYRTPDAPAAHRATAHYLKWRDAVADMMAEPRARTELRNVFPKDDEF
jgi:(4S)-4-hydroxy-5-phosphonooxypentane-2,3-dione isomerase